MDEAHFFLGCSSVRRRERREENPSSEPRDSGAEGLAIALDAQAPDSGLEAIVTRGSSKMKKLKLITSTFALATVLMCGQTAFAQTGTGGNTGGSTGGTTTTDNNRDNDRDDDRDYGWLGLLGLAGLAGLLKKPERQVVHHNDTPRTNPPAR